MEHDRPRRHDLDFLAEEGEQGRDRHHRGCDPRRGAADRAGRCEGRGGQRNLVGPEAGDPQGAEMKKLLTRSAPLVAARCGARRRYAAPPTAAQKAEFYTTCLKVAPRQRRRSAPARRRRRRQLIDSDFMAIIIASMKGKAVEDQVLRRLQQLHRALDRGLYGMGSAIYVVKKIAFEKRTRRDRRQDPALFRRRARQRDRHHPGRAAAAVLRRRRSGRSTTIRA